MALYKDNIQIVEELIQRISKEEIIKDENYLIRIEKEETKEVIPRIEVMFYKNPSVL